MDIIQQVKALCSPAYLYLIFSLLSFVIIGFQNANNSTYYCIGEYGCNVHSTIAVFISHMIYILFWTFVLDAICRAGHKKVSWFLLFLPLILFFILAGMMIIN